MDGELGPSRRREAISEALRQETGIDEDMIERLVTSFYGRVRLDPLLGPIFSAHVASWDDHMIKMRAFWSSVALMTGTYHGQPMRAHLPLPIDSRHFDHWLRLFEQVALEVCPPRAAEHFLERARRIAESLELGVAGARGVLLAKGDRLILKELGE